jgi:hypothetical protein
MCGRWQREDPRRRDAGGPSLDAHPRPVSAVGTMSDLVSELIGIARAGAQKYAPPPVQSTSINLNTATMTFWGKDETGRDRVTLSGRNDSGAEIAVRISIRDLQIAIYHAAEELDPLSAWAGRVG